MTIKSSLSSSQEDSFHVSFLQSQDAYQFDQELFSSGYTLEQLMELAGLSVAEAVYVTIPINHKEEEENDPTKRQSKSKSPSVDSRGKETPKRILVVCGPGNNGGDGLVAARHLSLFGYDVTIVYPKRSTRELHYEKLVRQCQDFGIPILDTMPPRSTSSTETLNHTIRTDHPTFPPTNQESALCLQEQENQDIPESRTLPIRTLQEYDAIVDAIFGFSFKGELREPFISCIRDMIYAQEHFGTCILSVDVPSGWNVDDGDVSKMGFYPNVLVSLTAPKLCSKDFLGRHFIGGRFIPPWIADKYQIQMPPYSGVSQIYELMNGKTQTLQEGNKDDWEQDYADYCAAKEDTRNKNNHKSNNKSDKDSNVGLLSTTATTTSQTNRKEEDWQQQYLEYLIEKENQESSKPKLNPDHN